MKYWNQKVELEGKIGSLKTQLTEKKVDYDQILKLEDRREESKKKLEQVKNKLRGWVKLIDKRNGRG